MRRGLVAFGTLTLVGLGLTACGIMRYEQREPWRSEADGDAPPLSRWDGKSPMLIAAGVITAWTVFYAWASLSSPGAPSGAIAGYGASDTATIVISRWFRWTVMPLKLSIHQEHAKQAASVVQVVFGRRYPD